MSTRKAIVLLSGGLDSFTVLALAKDEGYELYALSFRYGQRHVVELERAAQIAKLNGVAQHMIIDLGAALNNIGGSALTDAHLAVPKNNDIAAPAVINDIPVTYVPARNTIFLGFALSWAEALKSHDIFIGVNALDYSGYPDCRSEFIAAYEQMANLATKEGVTSHEKLNIHTPLISLTKAQIIRIGARLGVDYSLTSSCYDPIDGLACGKCDSCQLRRKGFREAGIADPTSYASQDLNKFMD